MSKNLKKYFPVLAGAFLVLCFVLYGFLALTGDQIYNSPDETANYIFIKNYLQTGQIAIDEPLNLELEKQIQGRSFNVNSHGRLVPQGFVGMIMVYGLIGKIIGLSLIEYLTPLLAVLAVMAFYGLIKRFFSPKIALFSGFLMALHPVFLYYSNRGMMNNIPVLSLVILAVYFWVKIFENEKSKLLFYVLSAFCLALAVLMRPSELLWIAVMVLGLIIWQRKKIKWSYFSVGLILMIVLALPVLEVNKTLYGSSFTTGYSKLDNDDGDRVELIDISQADRDYDKNKQALVVKKNNNVWDLTRAFIEPFGFKEKRLMENFYKFILLIFWWISIPLFLGLAKKFIDLMKKKIKRSEKFYLLTYCLSSVAVFVYYGSWWLWLYHSNYDLAKPTLDISYVRYFLPIYIFGLPFAVIGLNFMAKSLGKYKKPFIALYLILFLTFSGYLTFFEKKLGMLQVEKTLDGYAERLELVKKRAPVNASILIVPNWADKVFDDEYKIIRQLNSTKHFQALQKIPQTKFQGYYYSERPIDEVIAFSEGKLTELNLSLEYVCHISGTENLYKLIELNNED